MDVLIIKPKWLDKILHNHKIWEIRGSNTKKRGVISLAASGTSKIFGIVNLIDSIPLTKELWEKNLNCHQVKDLSWEELLKRYPHPYAWVFAEESVVSYDEPVTYSHPKGAVIWVKT